jgi:DNA-binding transcriptional MerR regulator
MAPTGKYTAADLARLANVPLRTVRFYVQQGLIDPPTGRGPGAHFGDRHLQQLARVRALQGAGLEIEVIRQHAEELERILAERGMTAETAGKIWTAYALSGLPNRPAVDDDEDDELAGPEEDEDEEVDAATAIRIPLAPGIELLVSREVAIPSPRRLVELALVVRRLFKI